MIGIRPPKGGRMDEWFRDHGITQIVMGPKAAKGHNWFATDEAEILREAKRVETARLQREAANNGGSSDRHNTLWESSKFVGNQALMDAISGINKKLDRLLALWDDKQDKTF